MSEKDQAEAEATVQVEAAAVPPPPPAAGGYGGGSGAGKPGGGKGDKEAAEAAAMAAAAAAAGNLFSVWIPTGLQVEVEWVCLPLFPFFLFVLFHLSTLCFSSLPLFSFFRFFFACKASLWACNRKRKEKKNIPFNQPKPSSYHPNIQTNHAEQKLRNK